jgi:signal transduction histidine kinase
MAEPLGDRRTVPPSLGLTPLSRVRLDELLQEMLDRVGEVVTSRERLRALLDAVVGIGSDLDLRSTLQRIVEAACALVGARYGALGVVSPDRQLSDFITHGIDPATHAAIGDLPHGRGVLGLLITDPYPVRMPDITKHPRSYGFPPNHPPMTSFLGVPVTANGISIGNLYLTDKRGAAEFSPADQRLVELFARHAGIAIDNARLHAQSRLLAVAEERERIGRDLHDGIIQSLYAVALSLEDVPDLMADSADDAAARVDAAIESINLSIRDIRNFIYGLRPEAVDGSQVLAGVAALAEELRHGGLVDVAVELDPLADPRLTPEDGTELLNLVREALSNAARHARARRIGVALKRTGEGPVLMVEDDGIGFDLNRPVGAGHHGIANMRARALAIGGELELYSAPQSGTRIVLRLPPATGANP